MSICNDKEREVRDAKANDAAMASLPPVITQAQMNAANRKHWGQSVGDACDCSDSAPPGGEAVVKALKKEPGVDDPFAVAWAMKNKGQI